ncbi:FG-GAP-like repeat-containing protein [Haloactinopolyspora alba]|nr:FG-GAP-like repeat-containing protein [Haloactinopolyspora alba]
MSALASAGLVLASATAVTAEARASERDRRAPAAAAGDVVSVADHRSGNDDAAAIEAAIAASDTGDTVFFPAGEYVLDRPFRFASDRTYRGADGATVRSADADGLTIAHTAATPLRDVTIRGLTFDNVRITLTGTARYSSFRNVTFLGCRFEGGHESAEWSDPYLRLTYTEGVTVDSCEFLRSAGHGGRGVMARTTRLTVIKDSYFGTTRDLTPGVPYGHFRTAINISGYDTARKAGSQGTVVDGNVWRRTPDPRVPAACEQCQDHGLYAWGTDRLFVVGNHADGWDTTAAGGALKLRNQEDTFVLGNSLSRSGILTYVYDSDDMPRHLRRMVIRGNTIDVARGHRCRGAYCGISFWRNFTGDGRYEQGVRITGNRFTDGGSIRISRGRGSRFCVEGNANASVRQSATRGVRRDCSPPPAWTRPLAGLHRGDFNGDGAEDFVHHVRPDDARGYWRAHLSAGDGFTSARWPADPYTSARTSAYGVQVGDFDGDGLDDLTYAGYCGDRVPCWRMHRSTGTRFEPATEWGADVYPSGETRRYGFAAGDFDGDGRDDLVARGYCGDREPCWRFQLSTGSGFAAHDAGGDARLGDGRVTSEFMIGDYDGDGRDDVAYFGRCGDDARTRWRFHLSDGDGFDVRCSPSATLHPRAPKMSRTADGRFWPSAVGRAQLRDGTQAPSRK